MNLNWENLASIYNSQNKIAPKPRWGHSGCSLSDPYIFLFGGYSDSKYYNDTWIFNWSTMEWIDTESESENICPDTRSNCTVVYDEKNERVILFGGGSAGNVRHNDIWVMNLK